MVDVDERREGGTTPKVDPASLALAAFFVALILLVAGLLIFQTL
jgi:preprotein translocase subunit Sec61beta